MKKPVSDKSECFTTLAEAMDAFYSIAGMPTSVEQHISFAADFRRHKLRMAYVEDAARHELNRRAAVRQLLEECPFPLDAVLLQTTITRPIWPQA